MSCRIVVTDEATRRRCLDYARQGMAFDGGWFRVVTDAAPSSPATQKEPSMADAPDMDAIKSRVMKYLTDTAQLPSEHTDAVSDILDGKADETGVAMDHRRRVAGALVRQDAAERASRAAMFPNANRLG